MQSDTDEKPNLELESWTSSLTFTGENTVYPVEMFVALMEHKNKDFIQVNDTQVVRNVLNHIPDIVNDTEFKCINNSAAAIWKQRNNNRLRALDWKGLKQALLKEFGQSTRYTMNEKLNFLCSIRKSLEEDKQSYLIRISMIVCYIEHGQICDLAPSSIWVRLLYMVGISSRSSEFPLDNIKIQNTSSEETFEYNLNTILDVKYSEMPAESDETGSYDGNQGDDLDQKLYMYRSFTDNDINSSDGTIGLQADAKHELNDNTESVKHVINNISFDLTEKNKNSEDVSKNKDGKSNLVEGDAKDRTFMTGDEILKTEKSTFSCRSCETLELIEEFRLI